MLEPRLTTRWRLELEVLSPLHVAAGGPRLLLDYDYLVHQGQVWVIDLERALERVPDERLSGEVDVRLSALLRPNDYAECARYAMRMRAGESPAEIVPCIRDVSDHPYLPGSSLKGGLRTALTWFRVRRDEPETVLQKLSPSQRSAGAPLERELFGRDPNHDLWRALRVGDCALEGATEAELSVASVYSLRGEHLEPKGPGYRWFVEALPVGARLAGSLSLDEYLFRSEALPEQDRASLAALPRVAAAFSRQLILHELRFYEQAGLPGLATFYRRLAKQAADLARDEGLLQLGWGPGWTAKTIGLALENAEGFSGMVRRFNLDRGRGGPVFPKTRRLVERGNIPEAPLGWVRFRLIPQV